MREESEKRSGDEYTFVDNMLFFVCLYQLYGFRGGEEEGYQQCSKVHTSPVFNILYLKQRIDENRRKERDCLRLKCYERSGGEE